MSNVIGHPIDRVDGPAKVTGRALYAGEADLEGLCHAVLVPSTMPRGRIMQIDTSRAEEAPGVLAVVTHENAPRLPYRKRKQRPAVDPKAGEQLRVFQGTEILFSSQPLAMVVAETLEHAEHAADLVAVTCEPAKAATSFDTARSRPPSETAAEGGRPGESGRGDAEAALAEAPVTIDAVYTHGRQYHNAIEPHVTIARWDGNRLTLYDKTQWVGNVRAEIAHVFDMAEEDIRVVCPFVGGAFGSALRTWPHVTAAAIAARRVGRPVRLELSRRELYASIGFRPHTEQRIGLGADRDGRLRAVLNETTGETSTYEEYSEVTVNPAHDTYSCPNVLTRYRLVDMHTNTPCPMRAPGMVSGALAVETAMDELAVELGIDPVELRLRNHADRDERKGLPWSSKELKACYDTAAECFGWSRRTHEPHSMRDGPELVGYGMATAIYPAHRAPASASAAVFANGTAVVRSAASDMGPGTYTSITQIAADRLGLPVEQVRLEIGDSELPEAPVHGGSITLASVGNAVDAACLALQAKLAEVAAAPGGPFADASPDDLKASSGGLARKGDGADIVSYADLLRGEGLESLSAEAGAGPGAEVRRFSSAGFGAIFAEVRVDPDLGTVRVPRMVGAYDVGRVVNPKTARSQCLGGMVGGIGMALMEKAEWDPRFGRVMNSNLAEYLVPVCSDVVELDVVFVPSEDYIFNPLGSKGLAELGMCGVAPAIGNAIYHATGKRFRDFPIMPEAMLPALASAERGRL